MNKQDFIFKLRWWIKEHLLFYKKLLAKETKLYYSLPEEYDDYLYQIITGQFGNAIYIGRSSDIIFFKYFKRSLYCYPFFLKIFFYKLTAQIVKDVFYAFFPRKIKDGGLHFVMRSMKMNVLLLKFQFR